MSNQSLKNGYSFKGVLADKDTSVSVNLLLLRFKDEQGIYIIYSPHLDLSGYGHDEAEAKESFAMALEEFIDYTMRKKTLSALLISLGWNIKKPKRMLAPSIDMMSKKEYVQDIFDKYEITTQHQQIPFPIYA